MNLRPTKMNKKAQLTQLWGYLGVMLNFDVKKMYAPQTEDSVYETKTKFDDNLHENCLTCGEKSVRTSFCSGSCSKAWDKKQKSSNQKIQINLGNSKWYRGVINKIKNMKRHGVVFVP